MELLGAFNALRSFAGFEKNCTVVLILENTTAVAYIHKKGAHIPNRDRAVCESLERTAAKICVLKPTTRRLGMGCVLTELGGITDRGVCVSSIHGHSGLPVESTEGRSVDFFYLPTLPSSDMVPN